MVDKTDITLKKVYKASNSEIGDYTFVNKGDYAVLSFTKDGKKVEVIYDLNESVRSSKVENVE